MKKLVLGLIFMSIMMLGLASATEYVLYAGQDINVGTVDVTNDGDNIYVDITMNDEWDLMGSNLYVGHTDPNTLTTAPGQFPYSGMDSYTIPLDEIKSYMMETNKKGKSTGKLVVDTTAAESDAIYVALHANVEKETITQEVVVNTVTGAYEVPYYANSIFSVDQGKRYDGQPVVAARSIPEIGLYYEHGKSE